jgi:hypothetical protein
MTAGMDATIADAGAVELPAHTRREDPPVHAAAQSDLAMLEILDFALVLFGRLERLERAQIPAPARSRVPLDREQTIFAGF